MIVQIKGLGLVDITRGQFPTMAETTRNPITKKVIKSEGQLVGNRAMGINTKTLSAEKYRKTPFERDQLKKAKAEKQPFGCSRLV